VSFFRSLGAELFEPVGYLFLATTDEGVAELEQRQKVQASLGVPVERVDPARVDGLYVDDVLAAVFCTEDGTADPTAITKQLVQRAAADGVEVLEHTDALELEWDTLVLATGAASGPLGAKLGVDLPVRPLVRQLVETAPIPGLQPDLPLTIESETGFHFRRRGDALVLAMPETTPRWGLDEVVDEALVEDWLARAARRYPRAAGVAVARAWAGLYDMTPDAHPIVGPVAEGVYAACGFSGHGFMQSPAVGRIVADELLGIDPGFDLTPYRLKRFAGNAVFPETAIL
jgi:sarcosine oxidase subunit beta